MSRSDPDRMDWSQLWFPGPTRVFTDDELARAGQARLGRTLTVGAQINYALLGFGLMQLAPPAATAALTLVLAVGGLLAWWGVLQVWRRPERKRLSLMTFVATSFFVIAGALVPRLKGLPRHSPEAIWTLGTAGVLALLIALLWWFVAVYRAHQIEARLREQADQQQALEMARQLATAQIQPHFLFNSLASLQHWVQAKDDRAGPLLAALTAFLRATLPMFKRDRLPLGDEAEAARQYLEVMRLRLGERLRYDLQLSPAAAAAAVPPGLLLTLVENAVEHGVMPSLSGAEVQVQADVQGGRVRLTVRDTGPGLPPSRHEGVGLANTRARLAQAFGAAAHMALDNAADGGCVARLDWPLSTNPEPDCP